jgi:predicted TIM-barrel fold metal-dependent hydrolase
MSYGAISSDDHLQEPVTLWQERLPRRLAARGPRLVELSNGGHAFQIGDTAPKPLDVLVAAGQSIEQKRERIPARWENVRPGFWKPRERLADMDRDGLWASVMYPNMLLDVMMNQVELDPELRLPVLEVYNDHMSEFCATDPQRLIGYGLIPTHEPAAAVAELERVARLGHVKGMLLPVKPQVSDWIDPAWDPLWVAATRLGFLLSLHAGKPRWMAPRSELVKVPHGMGLYFHAGYLSVVEAFTNIFWSGCFDRYPALKIISVEGDIGWMPHWKERADRVFNKFAIDEGFQTHPHEWFGRNFFATFEADPMGIRLLDQIGEDTLMWASDYPHSNSSFPDSMNHIQKHLGHLPERTRRKLTWDTAARIYDIAPPPEA